MTRRRRTVRLALPIEFIELCERDQVAPELVLRGFIADLCGLISWHAHPRTDGYCSHGSDERDYASAYYDRVGYRYWHPRG